MKRIIFFHLSELRDLILKTDEKISFNQMEEKRDMNGMSNNVGKTSNEDFLVLNHY